VRGVSTEGCAAGCGQGRVHRGVCCRMWSGACPQRGVLQDVVRGGSTEERCAAGALITMRSVTLCSDKSQSFSLDP
jgi:hypothetical protein